MPLSLATSRRAVRGWFALALLAGLCLLAPAAQAQACWSPGATGLDFGPVSMDKPTDGSGMVTLTCQSGGPAAIVRFCIYIAEDGQRPGVAPRRMTNYNGWELHYDVYADPARTQIIGPPPAGGGFPLYTGTLAVPAAPAQATLSLPYYGRVPGGQTVPAGIFQSEITNSFIAWRFGTAGDPPSCDGGGRSAFYLGVRTEVSAACRIGLASDLDFGVVPALAVPQDGISNIIVRCPVGTPWSVGLSNGLHAAGPERRMAGPAGQRVRYGLYKDAGRASRWGMTGTEGVSGVGAGIMVPQPLQVHGRVPAQASAAPGSYSDTVTVVLTY